MSHGHGDMQINVDTSNRKRKSRDGSSSQGAVPSADWPNVIVQKREHPNSVTPMEQHSQIVYAQPPGSGPLPPFYQANGVGYLTQQQALLNNLAVQGNQLFPTNALTPVSWPPGALPLSQLQAAGGITQGMLQYPALQTQVAAAPQVVSDGSALRASVNNGDRPRYVQRKRNSSSWDDGGTTEHDSSDSSSPVVRSPRQVPEADLDLTDFCVAVAAQAMNYISEGKGRISAKAINWEKVSAAFPSLNGSECRRLWKRHFKKHKLARFPHGVVLVCDSAAIRNELNKHVPKIYQTHLSPLAPDPHQISLNLQSNQERTNRAADGRRKVKRVKLTEEEEEMVEKMQKTYGNKWTYIAEKMNTGRTGVEIKNYWHNLQHKIALRLLKQQQRTSPVNGA